MQTLLPSLFPALVVISCLSLVTTSSSDQKYYHGRFQDCAPLPYTCGQAQFNISYPFRVDGRQDYCGYPKYYVQCSTDNSTLVTYIYGVAYQVKDIDYLNRFLTIVDPRSLTETCPLPSANTTIDFSVYANGDRDQNVTLFVNCSAAPPSTSDLHEVDCKTGRGRSYYGLENDGGNYSRRCSSTLVVPMHKETAYLLSVGNLSFGQAVKKGFSLRWTAGKGWCSDCVNSGGRCGYNSTGKRDHTCYCRDHSAIGICPNYRDSNGWSSRKIKSTVVGVAALASFSLLCLYLFLYHGRYKRSHPKVMQKVEAFLNEHASLTSKRYKYSEVKKMTKSFGNKLGQGGYGTVYKGVLPDGHLVAVKVLTVSRGDGEEFVSEVTSISRTSHVNIVNLVGFCVEGSKRVLIYEFMPNGSLDKFISFDHEETKNLGLSLDWEQLHQIAVGIARGLEYLHRGCNTRIVHFDIKPHNILLDHDFRPKIADFGLAKLGRPQESRISMTGARGTAGYIAPEVFSRNFEPVSSKSDVYSYGIMVLEMVGANRRISEPMGSSSEIYFPHYIYDNLDEYCNVEKNSVVQSDERNKDLIRRMIIVGLWCIQIVPVNRPTMSTVLGMLEGDEELEMPPRS